MSTNFLQWNPTEANQETDAEYTADTLRAGGATVDALFPSPLANKLFFQASTMAAAIAQFMVAQGISASDSNLATLADNISTAIMQAGSYVLFIDRSPVTVNANVITVQNLMSQVVGPAGFLNVVPRVIRVTAFGVFATSGSAESVSFGLAMSGGFSMGLGSPSIPASAGTFGWRSVIELVTTAGGSSGNILASFSSIFGQGTSGITITQPFEAYSQNLTPIDLTAQILMTFQVGFSVASALNSCTQYGMLVEVLE